MKVNEIITGKFFGCCKSCSRSYCIIINNSVLKCMLHGQCEMMCRVFDFTRGMESLGDFVSHIETLLASLKKKILRCFANQDRASEFVSKFAFVKIQ